MTDPEFLDVDDVLDTDDEALAAFGGSAGVRAAGLLASAVGMPMARLSRACFRHAHRAGISRCG